MGERESKMTQREFYNAVINGEINAEVIAHATESIEKLDARNSKRAEQRVDKHADERTAIANVLTETPMLASEIATATGFSTQKVSGLVKRIEGVKVTKVKVKGKGEQNAYSL